MVTKKEGRNAFWSQALLVLKSEKTALLSLEKTLKASFPQAVSLLAKREGKIIVTGVGKSGFIAQKIAATLTSLGKQAFFLSPLDALHGDVGMVSVGDVCIALSFSGGSQELLKTVRYLKEYFKSPIIAITGNQKSVLAQLGDVVLFTAVKTEGSAHNLAPMASTTAMLVVGDMLAGALTSPKVFKKEHFARFHPAGTLGLELSTVEERMVKKTATPLVREFDTFTKALTVLNNARFGIVGVTNEKGILKGVLTDGDIRRALIKEGIPYKGEVRHVIGTHPKTIAKKTTLKEALLMMETYKITSLFVVDTDKKVVGLLHIHMILENSF